MMRLRPTRMTVSDLRPTLSFRVAVDAPSLNRHFWVDLALASDPALFRPENTARRTSENFAGFAQRFVMSGGDAVLHIPPRSLLAMASQNRVYAAAALYDRPDSDIPLAIIRPDADAAYVSMRDFSGAGLYRRFGFSNRPDVSGAPGTTPALTWSGDRFLPTDQGRVTAPHNNGNTAPMSAGLSKEGPVPMTDASNGFMHKNSSYGHAVPPQAPPQPAAAVDYDDGFGTMPPAGAPAPHPNGQMHGQAPQGAAPQPNGQVQMQAPQAQPAPPQNGNGTVAPVAQPMPTAPMAPQPVPAAPVAAPQPVPAQLMPAAQLAPVQAAPQPAGQTVAPVAQPPALAPVGNGAPQGNGAAAPAPAAQQQFSAPLEFVLPRFDSYNPLAVIGTLRDAWSRYRSFTAGVSDTTQFPFSSIVCLRVSRRRKSDNADGGFIGTGFYIGNNLLLTNAHNFAENSRWHAAHSATIYAGLNSQSGAGVAPSNSDAVAVETIDATRAVTIHPLYTSGDRGTSKGHDLAVVQVGNTAPHGQFFRIANFSPSQDSQIAVCGYGSGSHKQSNDQLDWQDFLPDAQADFKQRMDADYIREVVNNHHGVHYNLQTLAGNSGSPVFLAPGGSADDPTELMQVIGVHSSGTDNQHNHGVLLTPEKRDWALSGGTAHAGQQSYYGQPMAAPVWVPITTALVGAATSAGIAGLQSSSGDLTWNLQKMDGWLPAGAHPTPRIEVPRDTLRTIQVDVNSPVYQGTLQGDMYAHFKLDFLYDGTGVGGVTIEPAPHDSHDNLTGGMRIDMQVKPLLETFASRVTTGQQVACVEVVMMYTYEWTVTDNDQVTVIYRLYGDGTFDSRVRGGTGALDASDTTYSPYRR